jgi:CrcB protein
VASETERPEATVGPRVEQTDAAPGQPAAPPRRRQGAQPTVLAAIALGGGLGAPARYGVSQLVHAPPDGFPWGTFWANVSGSFALGLFLALVLGRYPPGRYLRPFVATGFLGAYTTYSTFAVETTMLAKDGHLGVAVAYAGASLVAGFLVAWAGMWAARVVPLARRGDRA